MIVLLTGANGFVGSNVSAYLAGRGITCWALDVPDAPPRGTYAARYTWDDLAAIEWPRIAAVVHLAGKAHDTRNVSDPRAYFDINVGLTRRIAEAARGVPMLIFFSSVKACADSIDGMLTEAHEPDPQTAYGRSKLDAERLLQAAWESRLFILRPAMIHGPGNRGNLNLLHHVVKRKIPWVLAAFENRRSFTSIGNVARVLEALLTRGAMMPSGVYQLADDDTLSTNRIIELMAAGEGSRARLWRLPCGLVRAIARAGDFLRLPLNSERLKKLTESYIVDNTKLKQVLNWESMPISAESGMIETVADFSKK